MSQSPTASTKSWLKWAVAVGLLLLLSFGIGWLFGDLAARPSHAETGEKLPEEKANSSNAKTTSPKTQSPEVVEFPRESWKAASIEIQEAVRKPFAQAVELTGKITLNEEHVAHIFPLVEGRVDEVKIQYGDKVRRGDLLVVVRSKAVGESKLHLFQDRLERDFAIKKDTWTQSVSSNTQAMIKLINEGSQIEDLEKQLLNRPMGEYREKLMTAYIANYKAGKQMERLAPLSQGGTVTGKQLLEAEAEWKATKATLQSLLEQLQQDTQQASAISSQSVKELQTRVAVAETNLKILGFSDQDLMVLDPAMQGESISHYPILSPFDGTIISKDVVLLERVGPEKQILSIADLSSVWVTADIYEEHLPLLQQLDKRKIHLTSNAWPGKTFEAQIFYTGDIVDESTRTISVRALATNEQGFLKPGMFVNVVLPGLEQAEVLQIPKAAVQDHAGRSFVFVHVDGNVFHRRDVTLGRQNVLNVEVRSGLNAHEKVVAKGGLALKSQMLASLLAE